MIVTILPKGEGFSPQQFGAVALCVRDFAQHSRYPTTVISGINSEGFPGVRSLTPEPPRWWQNRTRAYAQSCVEIINSERPALAEIHNRPRLLQMMVPKLSCKIALHLHNDPQDMDGTQTPGKRMKLLAQCHGVYCVSRYIRDRFMESLPQDAATKLHVVYNGIEVPTSRPAKENLIVYAGRMTEGKGALLLAEALRDALPKLPGWRAVLIGSRRHARTHELTPHEVEIARTLEPLGARVEMPGFLTHPQTLNYFARAAIAVVPSVWAEPFGRTAIEAMAYGAALISSGTGGLREVTEDAALTLSTHTPQELSNALLSLANDTQKREQLQRAGRTRAEYFSLARRTQDLDNARDVILKESLPHAA